LTEAISAEIKKKQDKLWTRDFIIMCCMNLFLFAGFYVMMPIFPLFIKSLGGNDAIAGFAAGSFSIATLLMRPFVGWILDHKGRKKIIFFGMAFLILIPFAYSVTALIALAIFLRILHGVGWALTNTSTNTAAYDFIPVSRFGEGVGIFQVTTTVALAIAPVVGLWLISQYGYPTTFAIAGFVAMICCVFLLLPHYKKVENSGANIHLSRKNLFATLISKESLPAAIVVMFVLFPYGATNTFVTIYAMASNMNNPGSFFIVMAVFSGMIRVVSGKWVDQHGEGASVILSTTFFAVSIFLLVYMNSHFIYLLAAAFFGSAFGLIVPALLSMAVRNVPPSRRGAATSTYYCAFDIGLGSGSAVAGLIANHFGYHAMFLSMLVPCVICLLVYWLWASKTPSAYKVYQKNQQLNS